MDFSIMVYAVIALVGVAIGWLFASYQHAQQKAEQLAEREEMVAELSAAKQQLAQGSHWRDECELLNNELRNLRDINTSLEADLREVTTRLESTRIHAEDKIRQMANSEQRLSEQFENLANRIFEHSNRRVDEQNRQSLHGLLTPLREQLDGFRRQVQDSFGQEARERHTLAHEIRNLQQLNAQMAQEALNLTRALKGDNKTQGNWGEVVLTRVLEASGLREGYEYQTQVSLKGPDGERFQPDVLIMLPGDKQVVVDSKVSLTAYQQYVAADDEVIGQAALKQHVLSLRNHVKGLAGKDYKRLEGLHSLDFVLLFVPIEAAFSAALQAEPTLFQEAFDRNIVIVSPTTLLATLRVIDSLWKQERQGQNAREIAERAGWLYDKFVLFIQDLDEVGNRLQQLDKAYSSARNKLTEGRGNLVSRSEQLKLLGARASKSLPPELLERAMTDINGVAHPAE